MKKITFYIIILLLFNIVCAQETQNIAVIRNEADDDYNSKNYKSATDKYKKIIELSDFKTQKLLAIYLTARSLAMQNKTDSAYIFLNRAVEYGFTYKSHLVSDSGFKNLHENPKWEDLLSKIPEPKSLNSDPNLATIITKDIHHFWEAYDLVQNDSTNVRNIYKEYYFDRASDGMEDYMGDKVSSINYFIKHIQSHPKLYKTIRENTLKVDTYKEDIQHSFKKFKELYPEAKFPDVYFEIGAFTSGGTVSPSGLLIGTNQMSNGENVNTEELGYGDKILMNKSKYLPNVVAHELIHFQQNEIKKDTITLGYAINEGMADFLGELIS